MHLLMACAATLAFAIFIDRSRVRENGLLFVFKDYIGQVSRRVTLKRGIYTIGILLFVLAAWQAVGFDWAFVALGGDAMLYLEIVSTVYLVAVRGHIHQIARVVRTIVEVSHKGVRSRRPRSRDRRSQRHNSSSGGESDYHAEPAMAGAFAFS